MKRDSGADLLTTVVFIIAGAWLIGSQLGWQIGLGVALLGMAVG